MFHKILILGASGQVGQALVSRCANHYVLDLPSHQALDFLKPGALRPYIQQLKPALVINCVAYNQVDKAEVERAIARRLNAEAVEEIADICGELNIPLIHFSTDYVFPGKTANRQELRYTEADKPAPVNHYGHTKLQGERAACRLPANLVLRVSWVFSEYARNMGQLMATQITQGQPLTLATDQFGSPTYAGHIAELVWELVPQLLAGSLGGLYHLSGGETVSRFQLAQAIVDELARQNRLPMGYQLESTTQAQWAASVSTPIAHRPAFSALECTALAKRLGKKSLPSWRQGLASLIAGI